MWVDGSRVEDATKVSLTEERDFGQHYLYDHDESNQALRCHASCLLQRASNSSLWGQ
jgi:hypothetical protein